MWPSWRPKWGKKGSKKMLQKKVPRQTQTQLYRQAGRLPDSPPRVRGFLNKKQLSEQETRAAAHLSKKQEQLLIFESISEPLSWDGLVLGQFLETCYFLWNQKQKKASSCTHF